VSLNSDISIWSPLWLSFAHVKIKKQGVRVRGISDYLLCRLCNKNWEINKCRTTRTFSCAINTQLISYNSLRIVGTVCQQKSSRKVWSHGSLLGNYVKHLWLYMLYTHQRIFGKDPHLIWDQIHTCEPSGRKTKLLLLRPSAVPSARNRNLPTFQNFREKKI
jgi:hypothetical protein